MPYSTRELLVFEKMSDSSESCIKSRGRLSNCCFFNLITKQIIVQEKEKTVEIASPIRKRYKPLEAKASGVHRPAVHYRRSSTMRENVIPSPTFFIPNRCVQSSVGFSAGIYKSTPMKEWCSASCKNIGSVNA